MISQKWLKLLICVNCGSSLDYKKNKLNCRNCGLSYSIVNGIPIIIDKQNKNDQVLLNKQIKYFENEALHEEENIQEWQNTYARRIFDLFSIKKGKSYVNKKNSPLILDIGTGSSGYIPINAVKKGFTAVACDITYKSVFKAKTIAEKRGLKDKILWVVCDAQKLPFQSKLFSYVIANAVIEHVPNDINVFKEIDRVTRNKSSVFVTAPVMYRYLWPFLIPLNIVHDKRIGHLRRYDEKLLSKILKQNGFNVRKVFFTGHLLKVLIVIIQLILKSKIGEKYAEKNDLKKIKDKFGSSNVSVYAEKYNVKS